jgi:multiple sugar transport system ATP-binding protein
MAGVHLEQVSKVYQGRSVSPVEAVRNLTLAAGSGELLVIVGPSGSGKTTLLRMIAGLEEPSSGSISIEGRPINGVPREDLAVAMVFQEHALYPHMSVLQNLSFGLQLRHCPKREIEERVRAVADLLGLSQFLDRLPRALSGGEKQRVALGRAVVLNPKVFLFDEPLSSLDGPLRTEMRHEILKLHRRLHATMIYVTHDQLEAMALADRIVVLNQGELLQIGTPRQVYHAPANLFVAQFIGAPAINLFPGTLHQDANAIRFRQRESGGAGLSFPLESSLASELPAAVGKDVVFGARAEDLSLTPRSEVPTASGWAQVDGAVDQIEFLGAETLVWLTTAQGTVVARTGDGFVAPKDGKVCVTVNVQKGHFFDAKRGVRLG